MTPFNAAQLAKFAARLDAIPRAIGAALKPSLDKSAEQLVEAMKDMAPKDTGALADSIVATPAGAQTPENALGETQTVPENTVAITAGNRDVFYAPMVEYGTRNTEAQPLFMPAYRAQKADIAGKLKTAARVAAKAAR